MMKINPAAAYHRYSQAAEYARASRPAESHPGETAREHTDQIVISSEGTRRAEAEQLTRTIAAGMPAPASPERLESLRTAVAEGRYHIPTGDLVDAVMNRWFPLG